MNLNGDVLAEILDFLPIHDFCEARLTCTEWTKSSLRCHRIWLSCYNNLVRNVLPKSHFFNSVTIHSDHPLFRNHPLLMANKRNELCYKLDLNPENQTDWEIDENIMDYLRLNSNPVVHKWINELEMGPEKQGYLYFATIVNHLRYMENTSVKSREYLESLVRRGVVWHDVMNLLKLFFIPFLVSFPIVFCILCFTKYTSEKEEIRDLSWNILFPFLYAFWIIKYGLDLVHHFQHIYFMKARIHTGRTFRKFIIDFLYTLSMLVFGTTCIAFFHLRCINVLPFSNFATLCLLPAMIEIAFMTTLYLIIQCRSLSRSIPFVLKVLLVIFWLLIVAEGAVILLGFRIDDVVFVNYSVFFIPVDIAFVMHLCQSGIIILAGLFPCGRNEMKLLGISKKDIFYQIITTLYLLDAVSVQIILSIESIENAYIFISFSVLAIIWGIDAAITCFADSNIGILCTPKFKDKRELLLDE
jgi:hypothetical protein